MLVLGHARRLGFFGYFIMMTGGRRFAGGRIDGLVEARHCSYLNSARADVAVLVSTKPGVRPIQLLRRNCP